MKSPLRYIGAKQRALKYILPLVPKQITRYVEPFLGGASVGLSILESSTANSYLLNDIDANLINFFKCINDPYQCSKVQSLLWDKYRLPESLRRSTFYACKLMLSGGPSVDLEQSACQYFYVNRCSFSGTGSFGGFSFSASESRFTENSIKQLSNFIGKLDSVELTSKDYKECFPDLDEDSFIFADPPYCLPKGKNKLYKDHSTFDHQELHQQLSSLKCKIMVTYNNCEEILNLYKGWNVLEYSFKYGSSKNKDGRELIIRNY